MEATGLEWAHPLVQDWFCRPIRQLLPSRKRRGGRTSLRQDDANLRPDRLRKNSRGVLDLYRSPCPQSALRDLVNETEVLYVSPLKALSNDIQKNLETPLGEILQLAGERGLRMPEIRTAGAHRRHPGPRAASHARAPRRTSWSPRRNPSTILLTAAKSREILKTVETVIVDEIHAVADDKRGAHWRFRSNG